MAGLATLMSINLIICGVFAASYNAYMGTSDSLLTQMCWILATLAVQWLAFYFHSAMDQ